MDQRNVGRVFVRFAHKCDPDRQKTPLSRVKTPGVTGIGEWSDLSDCSQYHGKGPCFEVP